MKSKKDKTDTFPEKYTPKDRGMTGYVFTTQEPYFSNNVEKEPQERYYESFSDVKSELAVPINYVDNQTQEIKKTYFLIRIFKRH